VPGHIRGVPITPVAITVRLASIRHLEEVVAAMDHFLALLLPPEVTDSPAHAHAQALMETIRDTFHECLPNSSENPLTIGRSTRNGLRQVLGE
jgi:hypothetical protein